MNDSSFMRIARMDDYTIRIFTSYTRADELKEELQRLAYDIYAALNFRPDQILLVYNPEATDVQVHSIMTSDAIFHNFQNANDLLNFICKLATGTIYKPWIQ